MMKRHAWLMVLAVMLVAGIGVTGATPANSAGLGEATLAGEASSRSVAETVWFQGFLADYPSGDPVNATYDIIARIYPVPTGGSALWGPEAHNATVITQGWFNIELGSIASPLPDFKAPPYYVQLTIDGEILMPRLKLASVPSTLLAGEVSLPYSDAVSTTSKAIEITNTGSGIAGYFSVNNAGSTAAALYGSNNGNGPSVLGWATGNGPAVRGHAAGSGLAGDFIGDVSMDGFQLPTGASDGYVMVSDASGNGTWQPGTAISDGDWYFIDEGIATPDTVSIGTMYPRELFTISPPFWGESAFQNFVPIILRDDEDGGSRMGEGTVLGLLPMDPDFFMVNAEPGGWTWLGAGDYPTCALTDSAKFVISPYTYGGGGPRSIEPPGVLTVDNGNIGAYGAVIYAAHEYSASHVLHAEYYGEEIYATAVYGDAARGDMWTTGGEFYGNGHGVIGEAQYDGNTSYLIGVEGNCDNGTGTSDCYSIYGVEPTGNGTLFAGYFESDVYVGGNLMGPAASFKIDHPLDPTNMTLSHAAVESPDMMNVYNGNVVLNGAGEATVQLPDYFDAFNSDFRYQLTCIGAFAPVYVAEEISGNSFRVAGGEPGMKVSWMVTGIRSDAFAEQNRLVVEEPKTGRSAGRYLQPEAHGMPSTMAVEYVEEIEAAKTAAAAANAERSARQAEARAQAKAATETNWRKK